MSYSTKLSQGETLAVEEILKLGDLDALDVVLFDALNHIIASPRLMPSTTRARAERLVRSIGPSVAVALVKARL